MSAKTYSLVWAAFLLVAVILWLGGVFSLLIGVVFGFVAFGLVFTGMMCVLPAAVSHPHVRVEASKIAVQPAKPAAAVLHTYRSA